MLKVLDPILHSQLRLAIVSMLVVRDEPCGFDELLSYTKASSGNLSVQLRKLEKEQYIKIRKTFRDNYQYTTATITRKGIERLEEYIEAIEEYFPREVLTPKKKLSRGYLVEVYEVPKRYISSGVVMMERLILLNVMNRYGRVTLI